MASEKDAQRAHAKRLREDIAKMKREAVARKDVAAEGRAAEDTAHRRPAKSVRPLSPRNFIYERMQELAREPDEDSAATEAKAKEPPSKAGKKKQAKKKSSAKKSAKKSGTKQTSKGKKRAPKRKKNS